MEIAPTIPSWSAFRCLMSSALQDISVGAASISAFSLSSISSIFWLLSAQLLMTGVWKKRAFERTSCWKYPVIIILSWYWSQWLRLWSSQSFSRLPNLCRLEEYSQDSFPIPWLQSGPTKLKLKSDKSCNSQVDQRSNATDDIESVDRREWKYKGRKNKWFWRANQVEQLHLVCTIEPGFRCTSSKT